MKLINLTKPGFLIVFLLLLNWAHAQNHPASGSTTVNTCSSSYFDTGGSGSNYNNNQNSLVTICPSTPGQYVTVTFNDFDIENNFDYMYIFDGDHAASQLIGIYTGTGSPGTITASSTNTSGCLSFRFYSDGATTNSGWDASITCTAVPAAAPPAAGIEDCSGASVICSDAALVGGTSGVGTQELGENYFANCLFEPGENQSQWYVFSPQTSGTIGFEIVPNSATDYDWAIWGPYTQLSCPLFTGDHSIRCNASSLGNSGPNGETGLVPASTDTIEENGTFPGETTDGDCSELNVTAGEVYVMMLDNWSSSTIGFQLNWNLSNGATLDCTPPLPITLEHFEAKCEGNKTLLEWVTQSELNNNFFVIEKSDENFNFKEIGKVFGAGTTNTPQYYSFIDEEINHQTSYYRLLQVDYDGSLEYHNIISSNCHDYNFKVVRSKLTSNKLDLLITSGANETITIEAYNTIGKLIFSEKKSLQQGANQINISNFNISAGIYLLTINGEHNQYSEKLITR